MQKIFPILIGLLMIAALLLGFPIVWKRKFWSNGPYNSKENMRPLKRYMVMGKTFLEFLSYMSIFLLSNKKRCLFLLTIQRFVVF